MTTLAAVQVNPLQGRAVVELADPQKPDSPPLVFNDQSDLQLKSSISMVLYGGKTGTYAIATKDSNYVEKYLLPFSQRPVPEVRLRYGIVSGDQRSMLPWETHSLIRYRPRYSPGKGANTLITIKTADKLATMDESQKIRSHRGKISDVVASIWAEYSNVPPVIEVTNHPGIDSNAIVYYQSSMTDCEFLNYLVHQATNAQGQAGYLMFVRDDALHFHTPGYSASKAYVLAFTDGEASFKHIWAEDLTHERVSQGSLGSMSIVSDPIDGVDQVVQSQDSALLKMAAQRPASIVGHIRGSHLGLNAMWPEQAATQDFHARVGLSKYRMSFQGNNLLEPRLGDIVYIGLTSYSRIKSFFSGYWVITGAKLDITNGVLTSTFTMNRGEFQNVASSQVIGVESFQVDDGAPGIAIDRLLQISANQGQRPSGVKGGILVPVLTAQ